MAVYNKNGSQITAVYNKNGGLLSQAYDLRGRPLMSSGGGTDLTLMTYNVGQWYTGSGEQMPASAYPNYSALHRKIMEDNAPDIVGIEEYYDPVVSGHSVAEMIGEYFADSAAFSYNAPWGNKAIFSKVELGETASIPHASENIRNYLRSSVIVNGHTVHLFICHFGLTQDLRAQQSREIFNIVSLLDYFIVLGDFNATCMSINDSEYVSMMQQFYDAGFHCANCSPEFGFMATYSTGHDFNTGDGVTRTEPCDNIVTSPNIVIEEVYRDENKIPVCEAMNTKLDHAPLIAKVTVY